MKVLVKVSPNASKDSVEQIDATHYVVRTVEQPIGGRANKAVLELLSEWLKIPKSLMVIKRGERSKQKTIEISTNQTLFR